MKHLVLAAALVATSAAAIAEEAPSASNIEVIHWFTSQSEAAGIRVFADKLAELGITWVDTAIAGGDPAIAAGINRTVGGNPPGVLQFNLGRQLDELYERGLIRDITPQMEAAGWRDVLAPAFLDAITRDGHIVALPFNNYAQNRLWYNTAVLRDAGLDLPRTWDDMFDAMQTLQERGVVPLALGGQDWQEMILFNAVLLGVGGSDLYLRVWRDNDETAVSSAEFARAVDTFAKLRGFVDKASPNRDWNITTAMVGSGDAAFQFMGDWAKGELLAAGLKPDVEFGGAFGPGNSLFIFGGDVWVFPVSDNPALVAAQDAFIAAISEPEVLTKASLAWGSVPPRTDVDSARFDPIAEAGLAMMADPATNVPADVIVATSDNAQSLRDLVTEFWASPDMTTDEFVSRWSEAASLSRQ